MGEYVEDYVLKIAEGVKTSFEIKGRSNSRGTSTLLFYIKLGDII